MRDLGLVTVLLQPTWPPILGSESHSQAALTKDFLGTFSGLQ